MKYTEEEIAGLTPDEQEAIAASQEEGSDTSTEETAATAADESTEQAAEATGDEQAATDDAGEQQATEADAASPVAEEFRPELKADAPEGIAEKLADIDAQIKALRDKRREGTIELDAYDDQKDALDAQKLELKIAEDRAKWAQSQNENAKEQRWKWEQERFFGQASSDIYKDGIVMAALNASVVQLSNDPANAKRPSAWFLEEADRQVRSRFNVGSAAPAADTAKVIDLAPRAKQPTVRTIGGMPAAAPAPTGDDRLEKIGMLEGDDLESYVGSMSSDDRKKLSRGAA